jgi:hypothetical protein
MTMIPHAAGVSLVLPAQRDPIARLALFTLGSAALWLAVAAPSAPAQVEAQALATSGPIIVIATPTAGIVEPTAVPVVELAASTAEPPTEAPPPAAEPRAVEVVVEVTAVPTEPPAPTEPPVTALPAGSIVILPTATMTRDEFIASFGPMPDPNAKCAFVGCLSKP